MGRIEVHPDTERDFQESPGLAVLLTVIAEKVLEKEDKVKSLTQAILEEIEEWKSQRALLEDFERRHKEELSKICPIYLKPLRKYGTVHPFLFGPINNLNCRIAGNMELLETPENFNHELNELSKIPEGFSEPLSIEDLSRCTDWSSRIVEKALDDLMRRKLISSQKIGGRYSYRVNENIYLNRANR